MGQLPDEQLQKARGVVLFQLSPWKHPVIEGGLELLAQRLDLGQTHILVSLLYQLQDQG